MPIDATSDPEQVFLCEADVAVLSAVIAHPYRLPSYPEISFVAADHEEPLVRRRVERLIEQELVEIVTFDGPSPESDASGRRVPETFYGTTEFGSTVVECRLGAESEIALHESYARMEKPARIERFERAPRPPQR